jgi:hypothetical protein
MIDDVECLQMSEIKMQAEYVSNITPTAITAILPRVLLLTPYVWTLLIVSMTCGML